MRVLRPALYLSTALAIVGCGVSATSPHSQPPKTVAAVSIAVTPTAASLGIGANEQFTATETLSDGSTADITKSATWTVAAPSMATISTGGYLTATAAGATTVTASLDSNSGSAKLTVTAAAPTVQTLAITPASVTLQSGKSQQFSATATNSDGSTSDVTSKVSWSAANAAVATVSPSGLVGAVGPGATTISASFSGLTSTAPITVSAPAPGPAPVTTLTSIAVFPGSATLAVGATQQFTAAATYSDGSTANVTSQVSWTVANGAVAKVTPTGSATAIAPGSTTVSASLNGLSGSASFAVTAPAPAPAPTLKSVAVAPAAAMLATGGTQQFTATATYSDGSTANVTTQTSWAVANQTIAKISASGLANAIAAGSSTVTATLNGLTGSAALTITTPAPTLKSLVVTPATASFEVGSTQQFTATAGYSDGSSSDATSKVSWTVSNQSVATISSSGLVTGVGSGATSVMAYLNGVNGNVAFTVKAAPAVTAIAITPGNATFAVGSMQQFTATATYSDASKADVTAKAAWTVANTVVATISSSGAASATASGITTVSASFKGVSGTGGLAVTVAPGTGVNIATWHADAQRSGLNDGEKSLTPANVNPKTFGKLFSYLVDGYVYGEPLVMSGVTIHGGAHNVLYAATEYDTVYAFDADSYGDGTPLWKTSLLQTGETPLTNTPIRPYLGVTSTPVIDPDTKTLYVVSAQKSAGGSTFRLNALDIASGAQKFGGPVTIHASEPGTNSESVNGVVTLNNSCVQRAALLLANGSVYIGFGGCHSGWLLAYDAKTLVQTGVFNSSPNLNGEGPYASAGGIWMGAGGPAADNTGNVYATTGNGPWDGKTAFSDSVLKFNAQLELQDYFTPQDYGYMNCNDADLAAGGLLLIPGTQQALVGGKTGKLYLVNAASLGHEQANDAGATQTLWFESDLVKPYPLSCTDASGTYTAEINPYEIFGTGAYLNSSVYLGVSPTGANVPAGLRQFTYANGMLTPSTNTGASIHEGSYGTTPFISADGGGNGIVWMLDHGLPLQSSPNPTSAILRAYDAKDLTTELYNSGTTSGDAPGFGIKFTSPVEANGKVYIPTGHDLVTAANPEGEIDVYGLN